MTEQFINYIRSNFFSFFCFAFITCGGGIFVLYYITIGYIPEFNLVSVTSILAACTFLTLLLVFGIFISIILPGSIWTNFFKDESKLKNIWSDKENNIALTLLFIVPPICGFLALIIGEWDTWAGCLFILAIAIFFLIVLKRKSELQLSSFVGAYLHFATTSALSFLLMVFPVVLISELVRDITEHKNLTAGVMISAILVANIFVVTKPKSIAGWKWQLSIALFTSIVLFGMSEKIQLLPGFVMKIFKLGNVQVEYVSFKKLTCTALENQKINIEHEHKFEDGCTIKDIFLLNRLGAELYYRQGEDHYFTALKSEQISWKPKVKKPNSAQTKKGSN